MRYQTESVTDSGVHRKNCIRFIVNCGKDKPNPETSWHDDGEHDDDAVPEVLRLLTSTTSTDKWLKEF